MIDTRITAEMRERPPVTRPERRQILAGGEAAKRIPRIRQHHVERVHLADPNMGEDAALIAPVHLGLSARHHLEPAVQPGQLAGRIPQLRGDPGPSLLQIHLDPLVVAGETVLSHQPLVDHRALQQHLRAQPPVDHRGIGRDHPVPQIRPRCGHRRCGRALSFQVLLDRPPVQPGLPGDLRHTRARVPQHPEPAQLKPPLGLQNHRQPPPP